MQVINNKRIKVGDFLTEHITRKAELSVITSLFSIYAFAILEENTPLIEKLRLLFSAPIDISDDLSLIGDADERKLRNELTQQLIAQKCRDWLSEHAEIFQTTSAVVAQNLMYTDEIAIQGGADLTAAGLGYVNSNRYAISTAFEECENIEQMAEWFEAVWGDRQKIQDIKQSFLDQLSWIGSDKAPDLIYYLILFHIFTNTIGELDEEKIIKTKTGIKEHLIWQKLYKFQKDGVLGAIQKLEKYNGCIIADSVGLGKTFEALAIIKYYELRNDKVLVLCPKRLRDNWTLYLQNDERNIFCDDRFRYDVLNHSDLSRTHGMSGDINLETLNWKNYDLVVIDESHNFRNNAPNKKKGLSRYRKLMQDIIKAWITTKVLMLSATPVNSKMNDLKNQVAFITEGNDAALADAGINSIENTLRKAQTCFNRWLDVDGRDSKKLLDSMNFDYFKLLDLLTIARSRKHIEKYYNLADIGKFPERRPPVNIKEDIDTEGQFPPLKEVNKTIQRLHLAAYSPIKYVLPEKQEEYNEKYDFQMDNGKFFTQRDREESLIHLMRVNLLKRMESSICSFALTTHKLLAMVNDILKKIEKFEKSLDDGTFEFEDLNINDIETDSDILSDLLIGNRVKVLIKDCDIIRWKQELLADQDHLVKLLHISEQITPQRDQKLQALKMLIAQKMKKHLNPGNKKIIIFTAFADTATYLYNQIAEWALNNFNVYSALVVGTGTNQTTLQGIRTDLHTILTNFSPRSKERAKMNPAETREIELLFATDCISEGQNLQDCDCLVNYDIHWNPVRIIQRFGRIDRIGSKNACIQLVNFWPNMELDEYINLEARVAGRMVLLDISATGEENVIEYNSSKQMNDLEYRRKQLQQLQDAVLDLEDINGGISITDLTLNDFRMDLTEFMNSRLPLLECTPFGARASVALDLAFLRQEFKPGAIFCLKDITGKAAVEPGYSLAPYYLVFVADDGTIQLNFNQPKQILDVLKKECLGFSSPQYAAVTQFNVETKNGEYMQHYQNLLEKAACAVIGKQQEQSVLTLFQRGGIRLDGSSIHAVEDFEVVAFIALFDIAENTGNAEDAEYMYRY